MFLFLDSFSSFRQLIFVWLWKKLILKIFLKTSKKWSNVIRWMLVQAITRSDSFCDNELTVSHGVCCYPLCHAYTMCKFNIVNYSLVHLSCTCNICHFSFYLYFVYWKIYISLRSSGTKQKIVKNIINIH